LLPAIERLIYFSKLPGTLLRPPVAAAPRQDLVQIVQIHADRPEKPVPGPGAG
jgi:hypothetical protein